MASRHLENKVKFDALNQKGGYYYKDYEDAKIRTIVLNTSDCYILDVNGNPSINPMDVYLGQKQFDWIIDKALNFTDKGTDKSNWGVVVISHASLNPAESGTIFKNIIANIFNAYFTGTSYTGTETASGITINVTCDFTTQGAMEFICSFGGHLHYDRVLNYVFGRPHIDILNALTSVATSTLPSGATRPLVREKGTLSAEAIDIVSINKTTRTITCTRFGAGADRVINY